MTSVFNCGTGSGVTGRQTSAEIDAFIENRYANTAIKASYIRVSPSWANSALSRGLFDAVFPEVVPGYGGNKRHRRLGDMLNHAKLYLLTQIGTTFIESGTVRDMFWLYHVLGDPTLEMWTDAPNPILLPGLEVLGASEKLLELTFASVELEGAELTLYQPSDRGENIPVGRGIVEADGSVRIEPFQLWEPDDDVFFALTREDLVAGDGSVRLSFD